MLLVWGFMLYNLIWCFPHPLNIFIYVALILMVVMHTLQLLLLNTLQRYTGQTFPPMIQVKIFVFGVFELLAIQKVLKKQYRK